MTDTTLISLVFVLAAAAAAPILADLLARWVPVPGVVVELVAGIVIGPALGWVKVDDVVEFLSQLGLAMLMFLAGFEIELPRIAGSPLRLAIGGLGVLLLFGVWGCV